MNTDKLKELIAKASPLPWGIIEDSYGGKEDAWCYWHDIGPLSMTGEKPDANGLLVHAVMQALPELIKDADYLREQYGDPIDTPPAESVTFEGVKLTVDPTFESLDSAWMKMNPPLSPIEAANLIDRLCTETWTSSEVATFLGACDVVQAAIDEAETAAIEEWMDDEE